MGELEYLVERFLEAHTGLKGLDLIYGRKEMAAKIIRAVQDDPDDCCQDFVSRVEEEKEEREAAQFELTECQEKLEVVEDELSDLRSAIADMVNDPDAKTSDMRELLS